MKPFVSALAAGVCLLALSMPAFAASGVGCDGFLWPLATELAWMRDGAPQKAASGDKLAAPPADRAVELALRPAAEVKFAAAPTGTRKPEDATAFAGVIDFDGVSEGGQYQVTLSIHGWIDVVQGGQPLEAIGHTGVDGCASMRKSVRFEVGPGPFSIQVMGVKKDSIRIAVRPAAD